MNRRMMKKAIPKKTIYCYTWEGDKRITCRWWRKDAKRPEQESGYCAYIKKGDWDYYGWSLLWDKCKECGVSEWLV